VLAGQADAVDREGQRDRRAGVDRVDERAACRVVRADDRDRDVVAGERRDEHVVAVVRAERALVEDHRADRAGVLRVLDLEAEVAGAAL
jgi:hypothetical protein